MKSPLDLDNLHVRSYRLWDRVIPFAGVGDNVGAHGRKIFVGRGNKKFRAAYKTMCHDEPHRWVQASMRGPARGAQW